MKRAHAAEVPPAGVPAAASRPPTPPDPSSQARLPPHFTSFVGRDREVRAIGQLLADNPLVTLTGPGGIGKTRLAVEVARSVVGSFPQGCWFVDLSEVSRADQIAAKFAGVLGQQEETGRDLVDSLVDRLTADRALIVVDNCEHVLGAAADLVARLMSSCGELTLFATSRERLAAAGEIVVQVAPLTTPAGDATLIAETVADYAAVRLFFDRAATAGAALSRVEHAADVASICRRLDGLPLAIELAAARVNVLTVDQIAQRLGDRLGLLVRGPRTSPARQQALRATVEWSYNLLLPTEKALLRLLSVFGSSFSLESAEAVAADDVSEPNPVLDLLTTLVDKSLLLVETQGRGARYRMLQTIREFAIAALAEAGEETTVRNRHADHFAAVAEAAEPALQGAEQAAWLQHLERDHDNLNDALAWCTTGGDPVVGLRLAGALWRFWFIHGYFAEGRRWLTLVLERAPDGHDGARAKALRSLAVMLRIQGDYVDARDRLTEALPLFRSLDDRQGMAMTLNSLGIVALAMGDFEESLRVLGGECLALHRALGDVRGVATCLNNMGNATRAKGDHEATRTLCLESLALYRQIGFMEGEAASLLNLGLTAQATADFSEARRRYLASLDIYLALGYREGVAEALEALGMLAGVQGHIARSGRLLGAGERLRELVGAPIPFAHEQAAHDRAVHLARSGTGGATFTANWAVGRSLPMEDAVAYALQEDGARSPGAARPGGLTRRELQVVALVASGLKDRDIAERLHISPRTAGKHVEHIRDKLALRSRGELGAWATRLGVLPDPDTPA